MKEFVYYYNICFNYLVNLKYIIYNYKNIYNITLMEFTAELVKNKYNILNHSSNPSEKKEADEFLCAFKV